jgi:hypothetical protein
MIALDAGLGTGACRRFDLFPQAAEPVGNAFQFFVLSLSLERLHKRLGMPLPAAFEPSGLGSLGLAGGSLPPSSGIGRQNALLSPVNAPPLPPLAAPTNYLNNEECEDIKGLLDFVGMSCKRIDQRLELFGPEVSKKFAKVATDITSACAPEVGVDKFVATAARWFNDRSVPLVGLLFHPQVKLFSRPAQDIPAHRMEVLIGTEKTHHSPGLLERLDKAVEQNSVKTPIAEADAVLVMFVERVHGRLPLIRSRQDSRSPSHLARAER